MAGVTRLSEPQRTRTLESYENGFMEKEGLALTIPAVRENLSNQTKVFD
jgi:hypothetical protein